uniref:Forkhead box N1 n=1 Tax=Lates calcarifer TaxID=8187 RepID=A0A4W6DNK9_LATCA
MLYFMVTLMITPQAKEGRGVCFTQQETSTYSLRAAAVNRRHSADGTISSGSRSAPGRGPADSHRFHPYCRQFSDGEVTASSCLQQLIRLSTVSENFIVAVYQSIYMTQPKQMKKKKLCSLQVSSRLYPNNDQSNSSKYSLQSLSNQSHQENTTQPLFPKPIYSYSILIFMALKSSKTGSLPVSEIYSFMTEHFPYFKTAPDGWKNSVRHNLSLNKCFEKVESKNGNSSRKGCLWALNPAKVEKMQEELHKWRRKDPVTVRRSMAKPEELERLVGARPDKLRSLPPYPGLSSRVGPIYSATSSSCSPAQLRPSCQPVRHPQYAHIRPQQPCYVPPAVAHPSNSFALYSPCAQQPAAGVPPSTGGLNSPIAGKMPPVYNYAMQAEYGVGLRSMQDLVLEGDKLSLFPPLVLGNMWEELREDSLVSDPHGSTAPALRDPHTQTSCLQVAPPVSQMSELTAVARCKAEYEDEDAGAGRTFEQHSYLNGLHPMVYSGVESLAGYLTSCTTSISLM